MGRSSYFDSATWAQRFCTGEPGENCGPMLPPPPPPPERLIYTLPRMQGAPCLGTNATFPCPGGWANSCPVFLVPCSSQTAVWVERSDGLVESEAWPGNCINRDCDNCAAGTALKLAACTDGSPLSFSSGQLRVGGCSGACVGDGTSAVTPVCKAGEQMSRAQLAVEACAGADTVGWQRVPVGAL